MRETFVLLGLHPRKPKTTIAVDWKNLDRHMPPGSGSLAQLFTKARSRNVFVDRLPVEETATFV
jgi:hypothetical protein